MSHQEYTNWEVVGGILVVAAIVFIICSVVAYWPSIEDISPPAFVSGMIPVMYYIVASGLGKYERVATPRQTLYSSTHQTDEQPESKEFEAELRKMIDEDLERENNEHI